MDTRAPRGQTRLWSSQATKHSHRSSSSVSSRAPASRTRSAPHLVARSLLAADCANCDVETLWWRGLPVRCTCCRERCLWAGGQPWACLGKLPGREGLTWETGLILPGGEQGNYRRGILPLNRAFRGTPPIIGCISPGRRVRCQHLQTRQGSKH